MLCLTIRQPFVWEIFEQIKQNEYRSWPTKHVGPIAIHSSTSKASLAEWWRDAIIDDKGTRAGDALVFGAIVGVVEVTGCTHERDRQRYAWHLARPRLLREPITIKGRLKLWELPEDVEVAVLLRLAG